MNINVKIGDLNNTQSDLLLLGVFQNETKFLSSTVLVNQSLDGYIKFLIDNHEVTGKLSEITLFYTPREFYPQIKSKKILILGLGQRKKFDHNIFRELLSKVSMYLINKNVSTIISSLPDDLSKDFDSKEIYISFSEGLYFGIYKFDKYKTKNLPITIPNLCNIVLQDDNFDSINQYILKGIRLAKAECFARDLVNEPANNLSPEIFASSAIDISKKLNVKSVVYDLEKLKSFGMGAFIGVTSGSDRPPKFIHLTYEGDKKNPDNNIWIIGKTITFDTGGISLKGPVGMSAMKGDMGGGAAVLSAFQVICQYKPKVNVNIICPATDNMPSGSAQKPGDVVVAMNGISIEVDNTDAEGRLTLADAISYAKKNNASMIIDIATLTGAARVSLGEGQSAIFSNNDSFLSMLIESSKLTGEVFWRLPLDPVSKKQNHSDIADIKNSGGRSAGTITAAHFISEFVGDTPWIHIDIAATSMISSGRSWYKKGATGVTTRTIIRLILDTLSVKEIINR